MLMRRVAYALALAGALGASSARADGALGERAQSLIKDFVARDSAPALKPAAVQARAPNSG